MYNEARIQAAKAQVVDFKRQSIKWHERGTTMLVLMLVSVVIDLFMIAAPGVEWGWVAWMAIIITLAYLVTHLYCVAQSKRYHAKRLIAQAYIERNDYKNINNENKETN